MTITPSKLAAYNAKKRQSAKGKATGSSSKAPINFIDILKAMDILSKRIDKLEQEAKYRTNKW